MRKNVGFILWIFLSVFVASCTDVYQEDDSEKEKEIIPPGETYTPERKYNLNVVYYVPADVVEIENWHYRLSGFCLHIQNYFYENFMRYRVDRKFGLELNDVNPEFVKIHYIKSTRKQEEMQEKNMSEMAREILDYFKQNPNLKQSDHYLVYMPEYNGSFIKHYFPSEKEGVAFCGVDNSRWKISYFESGRASATFLSQLGYVLKAFAQSCFLTECNTGVETPFMSLMGAEVTLSSSTTKYQPQYSCRKYTGWSSPSGGAPTFGTPDKIRLMLWDVKYLSGIQLFNDDYSYEPFEVNIQNMDIRSKEGAETTEEDTLHVACEFTCPVELTGVLLMDDPWRTYDPVLGSLNSNKLDKDGNHDSGWDAYGVYMDGANFEKTGDVYKVEFVIPMVNHLNMVLAKNSRNAIYHELRFRFIGKNGMAYPHAPTTIKGKEAWVEDRGTSERWPYKVILKDGTVSGSYTYESDVATRYGTWSRVEEE